MTTGGGAGPRIVVDPGAYDGANIGDTAMLMVALRRLRRRWPAARIAVHTLDVGWLRTLDAAAEPLDPGGAHAWNLEGAVAARLGLACDRSGRLLATGRALRRGAPPLGRALARFARRAMGRDGTAVGAYLDAVTQADLVIKTGAGAVNDTFGWHAYEALETLDLGRCAGAVTALVGQGIGPIVDPALGRRAAEVLAGVDLIALRDDAASRPLLIAMGVAADRIVVTGDDALALCDGRAAPSSRGDTLGVNLRCAAYAGVAPGDVARIGAVLRGQAARGRALVALPIDRHPDVDDLAAIGACLVPLVIDGADAPTTPEAFLRRVAACRVVVTGSYHGAVLALGSGIPVVAIAASPYYVHKFAGLAGLFGAACRVEGVSHPQFVDRLDAAIDEAWQEGDAVRDQLRAAAARQVATGEAAFDRLADRVDARRHERRRVQDAAMRA
jgi:polysaccharide pyruvyl transferase WcaK-like protein